MKRSKLKGSSVIPLALRGGPRFGRMLRREGSLAAETLFQLSNGIETIASTHMDQLYIVSSLTVMKAKS